MVFLCYRAPENFYKQYGFLKLDWPIILTKGISFLLNEVMLGIAVMLGIIVTQKEEDT